MPLVLVNNEWASKERACISVYDHGFLYGDGIFESLRAYGGRIFRLQEHINRLHLGAKALAIKVPHSSAKLEELLYKSLEINNLKDAYIRLTLSRGPGELGLNPALCPEPTLVIMAHEFSGYPKELYRQGVSGSIVGVRRLAKEALDPAIKSQNFLNNILAKVEADRQGSFEGIMLNQAGYLTEGTVSNLFFVREGRLKTPSTSCGLLPGITRELVIELAGADDVVVDEGIFRPKELLEAEEAFLTNSGLEVMPLVEVNCQLIGNGSPGALTRRLHKLYREAAREK